MEVGSCLGGRGDGIELGECGFIKSCAAVGRGMDVVAEE